MKAALLVAVLLAACSATSPPPGDSGAVMATATPAKTVAADVDAGERAYRKCYTCHALEPGGRSLEGPPLDRIVERKVAGVPDYAYSAAMRDFAAANPRWTPELLDRFLADPQRLVPGNAMGFFGIDDPAERRALIAYLASPSGR